MNIFELNSSCIGFSSKNVIFFDKYLKFVEFMAL